MADLLFATARQLRRGASRQLRDAGLTWGQARALRILGRAGEPLRMSDLASQLQVVPRSATDVVDGLRAIGLVQRQCDPADRRCVLVTLTSHGRRLVQRSDRARVASVEEMLRRLNTRDRAELRRLLAELQPAADRPDERGKC